MPCLIEKRVFVCYKWEDESHDTWVEKFAADLKEAGLEAILDRWEVRLGDSFTEYMTARIKDADIVLLIITEASVAAVEARNKEGGGVKFEMEMATARRLAGEDVRVIGVLRQGKRSPAHLRDRKYIDFRNDDEYAAQLMHLVSDILDKDHRPLPNWQPRNLPAMMPLRTYIESFLEGFYNRILNKNAFSYDYPTYKTFISTIENKDLSACSCCKGVGERLYGITRFVRATPIRLHV